MRWPIGCGPSSANGNDRKVAAWSPDAGSHGGPRATRDQFASTADLAPAIDEPPSASPSKRKPSSAGRLWPIPAAALGLGLASLAWWTVRTTHDAFEGPPRATSIAVLPFVNMSPDGANEYFSDGVTEEIITALSKVEGLRVAARTSAFAFKGKRESVSEIGRQLRVGTVLEGSVRRAGDRLRVTAQLINVKDGYHLWADAYDRDLRDVFAVQAEIAQAIAGALKVKLSGEAATMVARPTMDLTAYDLYLKGRHALNHQLQVHLCCRRWTTSSRPWRATRALRRRMPG